MVCSHEEDATRDDEEARNDFWTGHRGSQLSSSRCTKSQTVQGERRNISIPTKYIDVTRTTHASLDVMMEKHIDDYWNVDGEKELSDAWTGFTRFILLNERPLDG